MALTYDNGLDSDRRRGMRIQRVRPVKLFEPAANRYIGGQTEDVSPTGLRMELPASAPVRVGRVVRIHVDAIEAGSSLGERREMLSARVVWADRSEGRLAIGLEYVTAVAAVSAA